jgi:hypothetical protein
MDGPGGGGCGGDGAFVGWDGIHAEPVPPSCTEAAHIWLAPADVGGDGSFEMTRSGIRYRVPVNISDASKEETI